MSTAGDTIESLPDDVEGLRALVLTLMAERDAAVSNATPCRRRTIEFATFC